MHPPNAGRTLTVARLHHRGLRDADHHWIFRCRYQRRSDQLVHYLALLAAHLDAFRREAIRLVDLKASMAVLDVGYGAGEAASGCGRCC